MKPSELYAREPEKVNMDTSVLFGCYFNHMPEIQDGWQYNYLELANSHIQIRYYKNYSYDGRRIWRLASVWFDDKPFMIIRNAGREGDDHASRFVTDVNTYRAAVSYLRSILPPQFQEISNVVSVDDDIRDLTTFYGDSLDAVGILR